MLFKAVCLARWRAIAASEPFNAEMRRTELQWSSLLVRTARTKVSIVSSDPDWTFDWTFSGEGPKQRRAAKLDSALPPADSSAIQHITPADGAGAPPRRLPRRGYALGKRPEGRPAPTAAAPRGKSGMRSMAAASR